MIPSREVQTIVLAPSTGKRVTLHFLRFDGSEVDAGRRMRSLVEWASKRITRFSVVHETAPGDDGADVAFGISAAGLRLLDVDPRMVAALSPTFLDGMRAASPRLGDSADCTDAWVAPFDRNQTVHAVVMAFGDAPDPTTEIDGLVGPGAVVARWLGAKREGLVEPFGFRDDITDPVIDGTGRVVTPGNGVYDERAGTWRAVKTGEAVLGHVDESGGVAGHPDAERLERNGSYLVIRKLEQDVDGFNAACCAWAKELWPDATGDELKKRADEVAEQMMGRRKSGQPLGHEGEDELFNGFLYRDLRRRGTAPPSSHVRRANPRDDLEFAGTIVPRHQLFRRGYPYDDGDRQGLLFMACCADLRRQFEFIQSHWLQDGNRFGLGKESDPITGQRKLLEDDEVSIDVGGKRVRRPLHSYVTTRGGEYFLLPGASALQLLARGLLRESR